MENIKQRIKTILANQLDLDVSLVDNIKGDEDLNTHGLDSITSIDLMIGLEKEFNVTFDDDELLIDNMNTLTKLEAIVNKYIN
jgi:acyl carrier protein